jgi:endonuclease YncB( thermonuclease family)
MARLLGASGATAAEIGSLTDCEQAPAIMNRFPIEASAVIVALSLAVAALGCTASAAPEVASESVTATTRAKVAYAVDGDTLRVELPSGELAYVRLVGIDTPEDVRPGNPTECGSEDAAASMESLAPEGAVVTLRGDSVADSEDRYGRILAHAFIAGRQLEIAQLRRGWAEIYRYENQRFDGLKRFEAAEQSARDAVRGVWNQCGGDFHSGAS